MITVGKYNILRYEREATSKDQIVGKEEMEIEKGQEEKSASESITSPITRSKSKKINTEDEKIAEVMEGAKKKSGSGKSASGKSASGKSASGKSASEKKNSEKKSEGGRDAKSEEPEMNQESFEMQQEQSIVTASSLNYNDLHILPYVFLAIRVSYQYTLFIFFALDLLDP
jgi:hypothetical protein